MERGGMASCNPLPSSERSGRAAAAATSNMSVTRLSESNGILWAHDWPEWIRRAVGLNEYVLSHTGDFQTTTMYYPHSRINKTSRMNR